MFCGKCGTNNPENVKICSKCGAQLGAAPNAQAAAKKPADSNKIVGIGIVAVIAVVVLVLISSLFGAGGSKKLDGYYIYTTSNGRYYALEISGSRAVMHYYKYSADEQEANVEKTDDGADLYFIASDTRYLELERYSPLHAKLSNDGKRVYLSSDSNDWITDAYDRVSKKEFEEFMEGWDY